MAAQVRWRRLFAVLWRWAAPLGLSRRRYEPGKETAPAAVREHLRAQRGKGVTGPDGTAAVGDGQPVQASGEEGEGLGRERGEGLAMVQGPGTRGTGTETPRWQ